MNAGPVASIDDDKRISWLNETFFGDYDIGEETGVEFDKNEPNYPDDYIPKFWAAALSKRSEKTIWMSRRCASEYCFFLEALRRLDSAENVFIIDVTEMRSESGMLYAATGMMNPEKHYEVFLKRRPLNIHDLEVAREIWEKLCAENAPLRVLKNGELMSASIDYFDDALRSILPTKFKKAARVVGDALGGIDWSGDYIQGLGDRFYFNRLRKMAERGEIEWVGSLNNMRISEIRRCP